MKVILTTNYKNPATGRIIPAGTNVATILERNIYKDLVGRGVARVETATPAPAPRLKKKTPELPQKDTPKKKKRGRPKRHQ